MIEGSSPLRGDGWLDALDVPGDSGGDLCGDITQPLQPMFGNMSGNSLDEGEGGNDMGDGVLDATSLPVVVAALLG